MHAAYLDSNARQANRTAGTAPAPPSSSLHLPCPACRQAGKNADLKARAEKTKFSDIFDAAPFTGTCPAGFTPINQGSVGPECLKLKAGMGTAAAFLETRRYAAMLGATVEFSK